MRCALWFIFDSSHQFDNWFEIFKFIPEVETRMYLFAGTNQGLKKQNSFVSSLEAHVTKLVAKDANCIWINPWNQRFFAVLKYVVDKVRDLFLGILGIFLKFLGGF